MQKTINIALQGTQFTLEEPAYNALHSYLESLKAHFASYDERTDIIADIEGRIAEHLSERLSKGSVGSLADIDALIAEMGSAEDLSEFDGAETKSGASIETSKGEKRLYRDVDNGMIAGVCAGLAVYFDIDPTIVRVAFALGFFFSGISLPAYIIMWIVVPVVHSQTDKLRMQGLPVNISTLERQRTNPEPEETPANRSSRTLLWIILGVIGFIASLMLLGMFFMSFFMVSNTITVDEGSSSTMMPIYSNQ